MTKHIAVLLFCGLLGTALRAQQLPVFSQYTELQTYLNPAALPIDYWQYNRKLMAAISYRQQWLGFEDAPSTGLAHVNMVLEHANPSVFGLLLLNDQVGPTGTTGFYGRYSYQLHPAVRKGDLYIGIGLSAGLVQHRLRAKDLQFDAGDFLQGTLAGKFLPDFGFGANFVYRPERGTKYYGGISMPQTAGLTAKFTDKNSNQVSIQQAAHIYLNGGAIFAAGQQGFFEPSFWLKYAPNVPLHLNLNVRQKFANNFWIGAGYSTSNAIHLETGLIFKKLLQLKNAILRVGYGFDYKIASYGGTFGTSHELTMSYAWNKKGDE